MIFLDTNVLVYASGLHRADTSRTDRAREIVSAAMPYAVSLQVIQEFYDRATRPTSSGARLTREEALEFVAHWRGFTLVPVGLEVFDLATSIEARTGYRYCDCAILAAARIAGCDLLLSEDMQHGQVVDGVRIENPFRA